jgi:hypothetical protein
MLFGLRRSLKETIEERKLVWRGWGNCLAAGNFSGQSAAVDNYAGERLYAGFRSFPLRFDSQRYSRYQQIDLIGAAGQGLIGPAQEVAIYAAQAVVRNEAQPDLIADQDKRGR